MSMNPTQKREAILVGWVDQGKPANCGETMKNQLIIEKLQEMNVYCFIADFNGWRGHPWVFLQLAWYLAAHKDATLILSTSAQNVYLMMRIMKRMGWKRNTVHWVIGGTLGKKVRQGRYRADIIGYMSHTLVESRFMQEQLEAVGVKNVRVVPNFKPIPCLPPIGEKYPGRESALRFVFLSRIMPEKGCGYILEAARLLNGKGYEGKFSVDFYGTIEKEYRETFLRKTGELDNVNYCGFLNLRRNEGYDKLSRYDIFLFPTYWKGEGCAGVFIDAFISGLPMIVTDWAHNRAFLEEGKTALFIPAHDVAALCKKMKECIDGKYDICSMSRCCQEQASRYDVDNVVTKELLEEIGIL